MSFASKFAFIGLALVLVQGCAVSQLTPAGQGVRVINEEQAKNCRFLDSGSTNSQNTLSENPEQEARVRAMNRVAELGGNALRIVSTNQQMSPSGVGSMFSLTGEAYRCPG
jgi:hypothetical protein